MAAPGVQPSARSDALPGARLLLAVGLAALAITAARAEPSPEAPAREAATLAREAARLIRELTDAAHEAEQAWTTRFVGTLKLADGSEALPADDVLRPARDARALATRLRTEMDELREALGRGTVTAGGVAEQLDGIAPEAVVEGFKLAKEDTRLSVALVQQQYAAAVDDARRRFTGSAQREAYARAEREARTAATGALLAAADRLRAAREQSLRELSAWAGAARRVGRTAAADQVVALMDAHLNVAPAPSTGEPVPAPTALDRFLEAHDLVFTGAVEGGPASRLGMAGGFAAFDPGRLGVARVKALSLLRPGGAGAEPVPDGALRFGQPFYLQVEFEQDPGPDSPTAELVWPAGAGAGRSSVTLRRESPTVFRSGLLVLEPAGPPDRPLGQ